MATVRTVFHIALVLEGVSSKKRIEGDLISVGRFNTCDIQVPHRDVSRKHLILFVEDGELFIEDVGSSNGTFVNRVKITPRVKTHLRSTDEVRMGNDGPTMHVEMEKLSTSSAPVKSETAPVRKVETVTYQPPHREKNKSALSEDAAKETPPSEFAPSVPLKSERRENTMGASPVVQPASAFTTVEADRLLQEARRKATATIHEAQVEAERKSQEILDRARDVEAKAEIIYQERLKEAHAHAERLYKQAQEEGVEILKDVRAQALTLRTQAEATALELRQTAEKRTIELLGMAEKQAEEIKANRIREAVETLQKRESEIIGNAREVAKMERAALDSERAAALALNAQLKAEIATRMEDRDALTIMFKEAQAEMEVLNRELAATRETLKEEARRAQENQTKEAESARESLRHEMETGRESLRLELESGREALQQELVEKRRLADEQAEAARKALEAELTTAREKAEGEILHARQVLKNEETASRERLKKDLEESQAQLKSIQDSTQSLRTESVRLQNEHLRERQALNEIKRERDPLVKETETLGSALSNLRSEIDQKQKEHQATIAQLKSQLENETTRLQKEEDDRLVELRLQTSRAIAQYERELREDLQRRKENFARELLLMIESTPDLSLDSAAWKSNYPELEKKVLASLEGSAFSPSTQQSTAQDPSTRTSRQMERFRQWGVGAVMGCALLAGGQWGYMKWKLESSPMLRAVASAQAEREHDLEARKFNPPQTLQLPESYADAVIYTRSFTQVYLDPAGQQAWYKAASLYLLKTWRINEDQSLRVLSTATALVQELQNRREHIHPDFVKKGVDQMHDLEKETLERMKSELGGEVRLESFKKFETQYFQPLLH